MLDLNLTHTDFDAIKEVRTKSRDLVEGAHRVKEKGEEYLYKTGNETPNGYAYRLKRAVYDNWAGVVLMTRMAMLWRRVPTRNVTMYVDDVDARGTSADIFFKDVQTQAAIDGMRFVLVDKTHVALTENGLVETEDGPIPTPLSAEQEARFGIRPFMTQVSAENVLDWKFGEDHDLEWVVIKDHHEVKSDPGKAAKVVDQRIVWTRTDWTVYVQDAKGEWVVDSSGGHTLERVPLIPFYGFKERDFKGFPVTKDIIDHCISIYNKFSDRDFSEYLTNNPIPWVKSPNEVGTTDVSYGKGIKLDSSGGGECGVGYLEPSGKGVEASRTSERDLIKRISEIAMRQAKSYSAQVQSEESLKAESYVYNSSLVSVATLNEQAEIACWQLMLQWQQMDQEIEVDYNKSFDYDLLESTMVIALSGLADKRQLSLRTLLEILKARGVLPEELDINQEIARIESDAERFAMPEFSQSGEITNERDSSEEGA